jgi:hypothetical protein
MTRRLSERSRSIKWLLKNDPTICLIKTPVGIYRTHKSWFEELCRLPWLVKVAVRVGKVADGFSVIISDRQFHAYRSDRQPLTPSLPTFSQQIENAWVYKVESRSYSIDERNEAATRNYALYCVLEAA